MSKSVPLATPCGNCGHPLNVHVVDPDRNAAPGDHCLTCTCSDYRPDLCYWGHAEECEHRVASFQGSLKKAQCKAHYQENNGKLLRCEILVEENAYHLEDHKNGDLRWTTAVSIYPTEAGPFRSAQTQVGGDHYRQTKIQPWDIIDDWGLDFYRGNALKYLLRAGRKGPTLEDLRKAKHYIEKCIERESSGGQ